jgi:hypothetical protein
MLSIGARVVLFLSSYVPLGLIFALLYWQRQDVVVWASIGLSVAGTLGLIAVVWGTSRDVEPVQDKVVDCRLRGDEVMGYIAGYLLPFLSIDLSSGRVLAAVAVFLAVLCYLYVTTDMIYINPTLNLLGFKVYEVTLQSEGVRSLISQRRPKQGDPVDVIRLTHGIFISRPSAVSHRKEC